MTVADFKKLTTDAAFPLVLRTTGGSVYPLRTQNTFLISDDYPDTVFVTRPERGIVALKIASIESIEIEHDVLYPL